jgi:hypothetical protein
MDHESESFDALQRLLALKRHEVPPPGYFDRLPREIHVRLAAARQPVPARRRADVPESNWLATFLRLVESRPSFVGALGTAVCGVIFAGIVYSHYRDEPASALMPELVQTPAILPLLTENPGGTLPSTLFSSTNPVVPRPPSSLLFDGNWLRAQPASTPSPTR